MNFHSETTADIVAEMREYADKQERMSIYDLRDLATETLRVYADRIGAAHKREVVVAKMETTTPTATCKDSLQVGNAAATCNALNTNPAENVNSEGVIYNNAKMREALLVIHALLGAYVRHEIIAESLCLRIKDAINAALASPPRNCDRYPTFAAAIDAWREVDPRDAGAFDDWLFAEAKGANDEQ